MNQLPEQRRRSWPAKFRDAFRGIGIGIRGQSSFQVHMLCAVIVVAAAAASRLSALQWSAVLLCIAIVLVSEMFNTALEALAKAIDTQYHPQLRDALDMASGAVLLSAIGAVVVGAVIFADAWL